MSSVAMLEPGSGTGETNGSKAKHCQVLLEMGLARSVTHAQRLAAEPTVAALLEAMVDQRREMARYEAAIDQLQGMMRRIRRLLVAGARRVAGGDVPEVSQTQGDETAATAEAPRARPRVDLGEALLAMINRQEQSMRAQHGEVLGTGCGSERTDSERLDFLESQSNGDFWVARQSRQFRGFRLHNTSSREADYRGGMPRRTVRGAIDAAMVGVDRPASQRGE